MLKEQEIIEKLEKSATEILNLSDFVKVVEVPSNALQYLSVTLCKKMPDGTTNEVIIKVADITPFLVMKGMAMGERYKEKDAYDIYFAILHYPRGIQELIEVFRPFKSNELVQEDLGKIKTKFKEIDSPGPIWVTNFEEIDDEEEKERVKRDVFERVNAFLDGFGIEPL